MTNNPSACDFFCSRVAGAYLLYLVSTWRRPIYRYETGDIEVSASFLAGLLDGYPKDRMSDGYRARFYSKLLMEYDPTPADGVVICGGKVPVLSRRGIKYMNALVHEYGDMLTDIGVTDEFGTLIPPDHYKELIAEVQQ